jgi:RNA polymerase sigma-70 factor (ECF subfamily)
LATFEVTAVATNPSVTDQETRQRLLDAAAQLFAENGFNSVTVRDICKQADANVAAVNYYFRDKWGLYREILRGIIEYQKRTSELAHDAGPGKSPEERLRHYILVFLQRALGGAGRDVCAGKLMAREMVDPSPGLDLFIDEAIRPNSVRVGALVAELMGLPATDPRVGACVGSIQTQMVGLMNPVARRLVPALNSPVFTGWPSRHRPTDTGVDQAGGEAMSLAAVKLQDGDRQAYGDVYREFHPQVLGLCRYLLGSHDEAEDASNEVFVRLPVAVRTYDTALPFSRWLASVASHYCIDLLRRRRSERRILEPASPEAPEPAAPETSPLEDLLAREQRTTVRAAIARLPERYSVPLVLRYYSELSYEEIAERLGVSHENVKTLIFRAKEKLRKLLSKNAGGARVGFSSSVRAPYASGIYAFRACLEE